MYPDPRMQIKANAPIGMFSNKDWKTVNPIPLKIMEPNVVTAPLPTLDNMERKNINQKWYEQRASRTWYHLK